MSQLIWTFDRTKITQTDVYSNVMASFRAPVPSVSLCDCAWLCWFSHSCKAKSSTWFSCISNFQHFKLFATAMNCGRCSSLIYEGIFSFVCVDLAKMKISFSQIFVIWFVVEQMKNYFHYWQFGLISSCVFNI